MQLGFSRLAGLAPSIILLTMLSSQVASVVANASDNSQPIRSYIAFSVSVLHSVTCSDMQYIP